MSYRTLQSRTLEFHVVYIFCVDVCLMIVIVWSGVVELILGLLCKRLLIEPFCLKIIIRKPFPFEKLVFGY